MHPSIASDRFIDFLIYSDRLFESWSIFKKTWRTGVFRDAESNGGVHFFFKIDICGRIDRFDDCEQIDDRYDRLFKSWSIFNETPDIGFFRDAESNGGVRLSLKSIFVVESIDSAISSRSVLID